ncbi:MAG: M48 family metallopeptidase [Caldisericia bacterium]|nr:M48 family metallopeptidase [Caldisericia bacterium]
MSLFSMAVCYFVGVYFFDKGIIGLLIGFGIAIVSAISSYFAGDKIILKSVRAKKATQDNYQVLNDVVVEMAIASGLDKPEVYIIQDSSPNAFATGRDPEHSSIAVTDGLLRRLNRAELQGVIAHEMSHIQNRDILFVTTVSIMVGAVVIVSSIYRTSLWFGGYNRRRSNDSGGSLMAMIGLLLIIFAPLASKVIQMAISRQREYLADSNAALLTRNPKALADALKKISSTHVKSKIQNTAVNPLFISEPFSSVNVKDLFSTHPPIEKRIKKLEAMAYTKGDLMKGVASAN